MKPFTTIRKKAAYLMSSAIIKDTNTRLRNIKKDIIKTESIDIDNSVALGLKSEKNRHMEKHK